MHQEVIRGIRHKMRYLELHWRRRMRGNQPGVKGPVAHFLIRVLKVPDDGSEVSIFCGQHCLRIGRIEIVALECMEVFVSEVCRLADALRVQKPKATLKRRCRRTRLLE